jgi:hypothetical protein
LQLIGAEAEQADVQPEGHRQRPLARRVEEEAAALRLGGICCAQARSAQRQQPQQPHTGRVHSLCCVVCHRAGELQPPQRTAASGAPIVAPPSCSTASNIEQGFKGQLH